MTNVQLDILQSFEPRYPGLRTIVNHVLKTYDEKQGLHYIAAECAICYPEMPGSDAQEIFKLAKEIFKTRG